MDCVVLAQDRDKEQAVLAQDRDKEQADLAQDRDKEQAVLNAVMNIRVPLNGTNFEIS